MGRQRSLNRDKSFELYKESGGRLTSAEIAGQLNEKLSNINNWRVQDKWRAKVGKVGAPFGNQNGIGNQGGAPRMNQNRYIHGLYSKYLPKKTYDIMKDIDGMDPLDILWMNIEMKFAAILRSQEIMFVKDQDDLTKEIKKTKSEKEIKLVGTGEYETFETYNEEEYEIQFAWDKQATFLSAQSKAMAQLTNMIKRYDEMLHNNWELASEEQKLRVEKLKLTVNNTDQEIQSRRKIAEDKLKLSRDRFEHTKDIDGKKYW